MFRTSPARISPGASSRSALAGKGSAPHGARSPAERSRKPGMEARRDALDVLGRMEVWLAHQGRTGLTPEDRVILLPRFQMLARDAGSVAALSQDFVGELERA